MLDGSALIIALFVVGFLLIAAEVFLPGLILGTIGFLCLVASVALVFVQFGTSSGLLAAFVVGGLSLAGFLLWLNLFPRTFIGRRLMLRTQQPADQTAGQNRTLVGESGEALTPLRPSGTARIGGKRVDVTAVGDFLEQGAALVVVAADGMRVAVRRKDGLEPAAPPA
ncbi:MAG: NfeD family protein [Chthoniobacterales bacterium]|jgi:membrane-bound serine protease (ClpP class)